VNKFEGSGYGFCNAVFCLATYSKYNCFCYSVSFDCLLLLSCVFITRVCDHLIIANVSAGKLHNPHNSLNSLVSARWVDV
jgi:hypothetical protein